MTDQMIGPDESPEPDLDFDIRDLRGWITSADPDDPDCTDLVLIITDGDTTVRFLSGMGGGPILAWMGARRLADVAVQFGAVLAANDPRSAHGPLNGP
jgi:hypothetical protein